MKKKALGITMAVILALTMTGCDIAGWGSGVNDIKGQLSGNAFECQFYDNNGEKFLTASGTKVGMTSNIIQEATISSEDGSALKEYSLSSVITINIDGKQIQSCGDTVIFQENGLTPDAEFMLQDIDSTTDGSFKDNVYISNIVNEYRNYFGKGQVVVIQSQLGVPICAYSGDDVFWEVREDLPKTTKLMIDGRALYIHRANFQIIDKDLLS